jgi:hypothetical protein
METVGRDCLIFAAPAAGPLVVAARVRAVTAVRRSARTTRIEPSAASASTPALPGGRTTASRTGEGATIIATPAAATVRARTQAEPVPAGLASSDHSAVRPVGEDDGTTALSARPSAAHRGAAAAEIAVASRWEVPATVVVAHARARTGSVVGLELDGRHWGGDRGRSVGPNQVKHRLAVVARGCEGVLVVDRERQGPAALRAVRGDLLLVVVLGVGRLGRRGVDDRAGRQVGVRRQEQERAGTSRARSRLDLDRSRCDFDFGPAGGAVGGHEFNSEKAYRPPFIT